MPDSETPKSSYRSSDEVEDFGIDLYAECQTLVKELGKLACFRRHPAIIASVERLEAILHRFD